MKYVFTLLMVCLGISCYAQEQVIPVDPSTGKTVYSDVVEVPNKKDVLYKNAQTWITKTFGDYKSVIQFEDKESGRMIMKGLTKVDHIIIDQLNYTITIDCKDSKYRAVISDIYYGFSKYPTDRSPIEKSNSILKNEQRTLDSLIIQLPKETRKSKSAQLKEEINRAQSAINDSRRLADNSKQTLSGLLASLKQAMLVKEDF